MVGALCDEHTVVCALQNGVEQVERVGRFCPSSTVVPAAVWISAEPQPEGWVWPRWHVATWPNALPSRGGVGTTRTVDMRGMVVNEEFLAWDPYSHMAFRGTECSALNLITSGSSATCGATPISFATVSTDPPTPNA